MQSYYSDKLNMISINLKLVVELLNYKNPQPICSREVVLKSDVSSLTNFSFSHG